MKFQCRCTHHFSALLTRSNAVHETKISRNSQRLLKRRSRFRRRIKTTSRYLGSKSAWGGAGVAKTQPRIPLDKNSPQTLLGGGGCCTPLAMPGRLSCKFGAIGWWRSIGQPQRALTRFFSSSHSTLGDGTGALVARRRCLPADAKTHHEHGRVVAEPPKWPRTEVVNNAESRAARRPYLKRDSPHTPIRPDAEHYTQLPVHAENQMQSHNRWNFTLTGVWRN